MSHSSPVPRAVASAAVRWLNSLSLTDRGGDVGRRDKLKFVGHLQRSSVCTNRTRQLP